MLFMLALIAKDDGRSIFASEETLARYLRVHRVPVYHMLREVHQAGLVMVIRGGGRWRTRKGGGFKRAYFCWGGRVKARSISSS